MISKKQNKRLGEYLRAYPDVLYWTITRAYSCKVTLGNAPPVVCLPDKFEDIPLIWEFIDNHE